MPQSQPMHNDQAWADLMQKVYMPAFIEKLAADYGVKFESNENLEQALQRAAQLRGLHDAQQEKPTGGDANELTAFGNYLDQLFVGSSQQPDAVTSKTIKQTAQRHAVDPELARAALSLAVAPNQSASDEESGPYPKS